MYPISSNLDFPEDITCIRTQQATDMALAKIVTSWMSTRELSRYSTLTRILLRLEVRAQFMFSR